VRSNLTFTTPTLCGDSNPFLATHELSRLNAQASLVNVPLVFNKISEISVSHHLPII